MIKIDINGSKATVLKTETLSPHNIPITCRFTFSDEWRADEIPPVALFRSAGMQIGMVPGAWSDEAECPVPPEILQNVGEEVSVSACVLIEDGEDTRYISTNWEYLGRVAPDGWPEEIEVNVTTPSLDDQFTAWYERHGSEDDGGGLG